MWWQEGWIWAVIGVALAAAEMLLPGFVLLGFALGALLVGAGLWLGILGSSLAAILLTFALASALAWLAMRRLLGTRRGQVKIWDRDINEN